MSTSFRIFLAIAACLGAGVYWFLDDLSHRVERQYLEASEEAMVDAANLLATVAAPAVASGDPEALAELRGALADAHRRELFAQIYNLSKSAVEMHVYVTDAAGTVLIDTADPANEGEDYSGKRDVALTLRGGYGARSTRSDEKNDRSSVMFVGAPVLAADGSVAGALSVSKPQAAVFGFIGETRDYIRRAALLFLSAVLAGVAFALYWFSRPVERMVEHARAVARGDRPALKRSRNPEAAALGDAIEAMRHALEDRKFTENYVQTLTHEMKSPVAAIRGAAELLDDPDMSPSQRERFLANIQGETARLQNTIDRLLALSALEGRPALENPRRFDLAAVVRRACDDHARSLAARGVTLDIDTSSPTEVRGDEHLIELAVSNLLQNAADFAPDGSEVAVRVATDSAAATVTVTDQGPGVPAYAAARVFERFYSLPHPATGRKSSGLGLCFVKEAAQLHSGRAALANNPPPATGATATLSLPVG